MGLSAFTPATETVAFPGGEVAVRGLCLDDLTVLVRRHYDTVSGLFDRYVRDGASSAVDAAIEQREIDAAQLRGLAFEVMDEAPEMIADVIALAAGEPGARENAKTLPVGTQLDLIERVIRLTLEAEGGPEKLVETVSRLAESLAALTASRSP